MRFVSALSFAWTADRVAAVVLGAALVAFLFVFFFGARRREARAVMKPRAAGAEGAGAAVPEAEARVVVSGGYDPEIVVAVKDVPLTLVFDRRESNPCSDEVVIPEFGIRQSLAANAETRVRIVPRRTGEFPFACGMNMLHGLLRVEEAPA